MGCVYFLTVQFSRNNTLFFSTSFEIDINYSIIDVLLCQALFYFFLKLFLCLSVFCLLGSHDNLLYSFFYFLSSIFLNTFQKNGEGGIWTHAPLLTTYPLSRRAPSTTWVLLQMLSKNRRGWDSNPRPLAESPVFKTGSLNHSDTSPELLFSNQLLYHTLFYFICQHFFSYFFISLQIFINVAIFSILI